MYVSNTLRSLCFPQFMQYSENLSNCKRFFNYWASAHLSIFHRPGWHIKRWRRFTVSWDKKTEYVSEALFQQKIQDEQTGVDDWPLMFWQSEAPSYQSDFNEWVKKSSERIYSIHITSASCKTHSQPQATGTCLLRHHNTTQDVVKHFAFMTMKRIFRKTRFWFFELIQRKTSLKVYLLVFSEAFNLELRFCFC